MVEEIIVGSKNETKCDIRCTSARGHKCNCSCGGENHGADWTQLGRPMNKVLAA